MPYEYKCIVIDTAYHNQISFSHCLITGNQLRGGKKKKSFNAKSCWVYARKCAETQEEGADLFILGMNVLIDQTRVNICVTIIDCI